MFEFIPLLLFLGTFLYTKDVFLGLIVLMITMPIGLLLKYIVKKELDKMFFWSTVLLYPFGGLALYFRDSDFLIWKPTAVYWIFAAAFLLFQLVGDRPLVRRFFDATGELPTDRLTPVQWRNLNTIWVVFWVAMGLINLYVGYNYSLEFWASFKVFGSMGIMLVFITAQVFWIAWKINQGEPAESEEQA